MAAGDSDGGEDNGDFFTFASVEQQRTGIAVTDGLLFGALVTFGCRGRRLQCVDVAGGGFQRIIVVQSTQAFQFLAGFDRIAVDRNIVHNQRAFNRSGVEEDIKIRSVFGGGGGDVFQFDATGNGLIDLGHRN